MENREKIYKMFKATDVSFNLLKPGSIFKMFVSEEPWEVFLIPS